MLVVFLGALVFLFARPSGSPSSSHLFSMPHSSHRRPATSRRLALGCFLAVVLALVPTRLRGAESAGRRFDVPAGEAMVTLRQFSAQAGVQLLVSSDDIRGVSTHAVKGTFTPMAALQQMLAHTRLIAREERTTGAIAVIAARSKGEKDEGSNPPNNPKK